MWVVNTLLAGCAILMATKLAGDWKRGNERYTRLGERSGARAGLVSPSIAEPAPVSGGEVIAKNLFSADRNNDRPVEARAMAQQPLPVVIGTMRLAQGYEALMAESGQSDNSRFRRIKPGQQIAGYTVAEIRDEAVVVEYQGQKTEINVYQSARSVRPAAAAPAARSAAPGPVVQTSGSTPAPAASAPAPDAPTSGTVDGKTVDLTPPFEGVTVTIEGNRKRFERFTAFGPQVWYEDIK
jgi:hypothetical protein